MLAYILEIRSRLLQILILFSVTFFICFFLANPLFQGLILPFFHNLPRNETLIATRITSTVFTPLKIAIDFALFVTIPYVMFHVWRFSAPALYHKEQQILKQVIVFSVLLFIAGGGFCYSVVLPLMMQFFIHALPAQVRLMPDMADATDFIIRMLILFGLCFQVPLVCFVFVRLGMVHFETLVSARPYVIVASFILGMILTPPDVISQVLLAVPLCLLYELGLFFAKRTRVRR